jgi:hypothetical protein
MRLMDPIKLALFSPTRLERSDNESICLPTPETTTKEKLESNTARKS